MYISINCKIKVNNIYVCMYCILWLDQLLPMADSIFNMFLIIRINDKFVKKKKNNNFF